MPRDVSGNTQPLPGTIVSTGDTILPSQHNPMVNDVYAMMTQSLSRDGQGGMRAPLDMSNFRIVNVGAATQPSDAVSLSQFKTGTPIGAVMDFAGSTAPDTWLLCFGQAVSRSTYAPLFAIIGTSFGSGDGSSTFNLPDYRGRVCVGKDDMGGTDSTRMSGFFGALARTIGGVFGISSTSLTIDQIPSHNHGGSTSTDGAHRHNYIGGKNDSGLAGGGGYLGTPESQPTTTDGAHSHTIPSQGGGQVHTNTQPSIVMNKIIKVSY